jgi:hypothetical protein
MTAEVRVDGGNMPASYQGSMTFPAGNDDVFQACLQAVPQCGFRIAESHPEARLIKARARMSMRSWGENVTITTRTDGRADIKSSCRWWIQVIDYGKNKTNVNALFSALRLLLPPQP